MSTYVLMKILESAPSRYDRGIRILTLGRLEPAYDRIASHIQKGDRVLDIGCGTGALTIRAAHRGASVMGIDINPQMLDMAKRRARERGVLKNVTFLEMGVGELDTITEQYDVIMSGLCFSELTEGELDFTVRHAKRLLRQGGLFLIADEVRPRNILKRIASLIIRFPLVIITYLLTQTTTRAVHQLPEKVKEAGFEIQSETTNPLGTFVELVCENP
jgi:demethylmenaquinone methyltransferase/2-methoxy-6-polyprenyl-1,4-benzoquinol methylase